MIEYIPNEAHYSKVLSTCAAVQHTLWIGTADIKDLYVKVGRTAAPFLRVLNELIQRGVAIRLIHAKKPGPRFQEDFKKYPALAQGLEMMLCPRVHFKILSFDNKQVYIGSANLTGAGIGMKNAKRRNFEAGILTTHPQLVSQATEQFDSLWRGDHCPSCGRRQYCKKPIGNSFVTIFNNNLNYLNYLHLS